MDRAKDILNSRFVIDGVQQPFTPAGLLAQVMDYPQTEPVGRVVDESPDVPLDYGAFQNLSPEECLSSLDASKLHFPLPFAEAYTKMVALESLTELIWRKGHFRLGDLSLKVWWKLNPGPVGAKTAFYQSVSALADYLDALGIRLDSFSLSLTRSASSLRCSTVLARNPFDDDAPLELPFRTSHPKLSTLSACTPALIPDKRSWVVFIPFETAQFRLGGSQLSQSTGDGGAAPQIEDPDYFIDCYEVVRELVEDGVVISGTSIGTAGLLPALKKLSSLGGCSLDADISDVMKYYGEQSAVRVLFAGVPGVVIQVRDIDFDYLDAELLLQDIAYFPLGHPSADAPGEVKLNFSAKSGIQNILDSLILNQGAEGED
ncbi:MAG: hypothetical protein J5764_06600 [Bacteroidales bacterium]|nr:hypothetical protein [Bacteroidales bacterium]